MVTEVQDALAADSEVLAVTLVSGVRREMGNIKVCPRPCVWVVEEQEGRLGQVIFNLQGIKSNEKE